MKLTGDIAHLVIIEDRFTAFITRHVSDTHPVVTASDRAS